MNNVKKINTKREDFVEGNFEDKYHTKNPISKKLVDGFLDSLRFLLEQIDEPRKIIEIGAGEGILTKIIANKFPDSEIIASDISENILKKTRKYLRSNKNVKIRLEDAENISFKKNYFDLVVCCEVLEHVNHTRRALSEINRISKNQVILSVPREPIWRILNLARGKYIKSLGNTPGHFNHWSSKSFRDFVKRGDFKIERIKCPLPWVMVLAKKI